MLTKKCVSPLLISVAALVLLGFVAFSPMVFDTYASASEKEKSVDITSQEVNQKDSNNDEILEDEEDQDAEKNNSEEDSDKKDNKNKEEAKDEIGSDGFPESYQPLLDELKDEHPDWEFVPADTGVTWKTALDAEDEGSRTLVDPDVDKKQRENSDKTYDGRWYRANRKTIAHYMDPRNFMNEKDVFQFLVQTYEDGAQSKDTVADVIDGSFMEEKKPGGDYDSYAECIYEAGKKADVNPNVLAAMIIMEQGWDGSSLCSGKKDGYKGYYNFFNIGAWTTDSMSSVERGLWYAKGEGEDNTSYGRPWNSPYKAIVGGAKFYYSNYISENQNTYYTKKYNVMNGADSIGSHEYMTNVSGAVDEGRLLRRAYEDNGDMSLTFEIPVYEDMPKKTCKLPQ